MVAEFHIFKPLSLIVWWQWSRS